jgi:hypothetical protein
MAIEDISGFIAEIAVHFAPPKYDTANERDAWLRSIQTALKGSSSAVLARAAQIIIDRRKNRYFPLVADLREAIREAADELRFDQHMQTLPTLRQSLGDEWTQERVNLAYQLIKCGMGREAAQDDPCWILGLWHFCRKHQRLPAGQEIDELKRGAREFDESYLKCVRGQAGPVGPMLEKLGASMLHGDAWKSREKLCAEVLGR